MSSKLKNEGLVGLQNNGLDRDVLRKWQRSLQQQPPYSSSSLPPLSLPSTSSLSSLSSSSPFLLEATAGGRTLFIQVTPKPALEAIVDGQEIVCNISFRLSRHRKTMSAGRKNDIPDAEKVEDKRGERQER